MIKSSLCYGLLFSFIASIFLLTDTYKPANAAKDDLIPLEYFGQLPYLSRPALSPDGKRVAALMQRKGHLALVILPIHPGLNENPTSIPMDDAEYNWVRWVNNNRLIAGLEFPWVSPNGVDTFQRRLIGVDRDGRNYKLFKPYNDDALAIPQVQDDIVDMMPEDSRRIMLQIDKKGIAENAVYSLDAKRGTMKLVQKKRPNIDNWIADHEGNIRLGYGQNGRTLQFHVVARRSVDEDWTVLTEHPFFENHGGTPLALDCRNPSRFYILSSYKTGRRGVYLFDLDEGDVVEQVYVHDTYDVSGINMHKITGCLAGIRYISDAPQTVYLEEPYKKLSRRLAATFKGKTVSLETSSADHRYWIISVSSASQPRQYYYYDSAASAIELWGESYPGLKENDMAESQTVSYKSRDGIDIPAFLIYPNGERKTNLPTIILPHGGPASRDVQLFNFWDQFLASRGYIVFKPNFRGSTGYGQAFQGNALSTYGGTAVNDIIDGARWLIEEGIADPTKICAVGGSYGGYAALMSVIEAPGLFKCAISLNGVSNPVAQVKYSENFSNSKVIDAIILGDRKKRDLKDFSPYHRAMDINVPVLLLHSTKDRNVRFDQSEEMNHQLTKLGKDVRFVVLQDDSHYLEWQKNRMIFLEEMEDFLADYIGD